MPRLEISGSRSWAWSVFHRCLPRPACMIDLDYVECCRYCHTPLIVAELARDMGQNDKPSSIVRNLAHRASIVGLLIYYQEEAIISAVRETLGYQPESFPILDYEGLNRLYRYLIAENKPIMRVRRVYPPNGNERQMTTRQFFNEIYEIHKKHEAKCPSKS
jgi:hypothetical protein